MTRTEYFRFPTGATLYVKERPLNATWATGIIAGSENGATGEYSFALLDEAKDYEIFNQAGGSPASSDTPVGSIGRTEVSQLATNTITADSAAADFIGASEIASSASQEIADAIAADWVAGDASPLAVVSALKADSEWFDLTALNALITAIKAITDQFNFTVSGQVDANALTGGGGGGGLDAAGVRAAVGLASANLDTQLADIPTSAEFEARTLVAASYATATAVGQVQADLTGLDAIADALTTELAKVPRAGHTHRWTQQEVVTAGQVVDVTIAEEP